MDIVLNGLSRVIYLFEDDDSESFLKAEESKPNQKVFLRGEGSNAPVRFEERRRPEASTLVNRDPKEKRRLPERRHQYGD
jgi:hypothetical protein